MNRKVIIYDVVNPPTRPADVNDDHQKAMKALNAKIEELFIFEELKE